MDLQNSSQENMPFVPSEKSKGAQIALGVIVGIIQPTVMSFFVNMLARQVMGGSVLSAPSIILVFLPLILEVIFWRKKYPHFVRGAIIGTILVPLIGLGLCFVLLSGFGR